MSSTIVASGSTLDLSGIIPFDTIEVQGTTADTDLVLTANATLDNSGTILLDGADSRIYGNSGFANALDDVNGTIEGAGQIGINDPGHNLSLINESGGTIDANSTLQLGLLLKGSPPGSNAGLIEATNTGGLLIQEGTIDNAGGTLLASGMGNNIVLASADLVGGTLSAINGGLIEAIFNQPFSAQISSADTLDGSTTPVTITPGSTVEVVSPAFSRSGETLLLNGTIANSGTILDAATVDETTQIQLFGGDTAILTGGGGVDLTGPNAVILGTSGTPATLDNLHNTIEGAGQIGVNNTADQLVLINETAGTVDANSTGGMTIALGGPTLSNAGLIETGIGGASLTIASPISGTGTLRIGAGTDMSLGSAVASGQTIEFTGSPDVLAISQALSMDATIEGFRPQDVIYLPNVPFNGGADVLSYGNSTLTISNAGSTLATLDIQGPYVTSDFTLTADTKGGSDLTTDIVPCFARGTRIATGRGEVAVEELRIGDGLRTISGAVRQIVWIGDRQVDCRRHPRPDLVWPVRIRAGAFGDWLPQRNLLLSPDHAVFAEGALIPAKYLINGATIVQEPADSVHYFHVELASHDVLLAERLLVESYLDTGNRAAFANGAQHAMLHPDFAARSWDDACAPLMISGAPVSAVRKRLLARVEMLGYRLVADPDLHLRVGRRTIRASRLQGKLHQFVLPAGTREVSIVSRTGIPAGLDLASEDCRELGARIGAIFVDEDHIPLDSTLLAAGFHSVERKGHELWRWTDGMARLVLPEPPRCGKPLLLELLVRETMACWQAPASDRARPGERRGRACRPDTEAVRAAGARARA